MRINGRLPDPADQALRYGAGLDVLECATRS
jgi:hypothetical protein